MEGCGLWKLQTELDCITQGYFIKKSEPDKQNYDINRTMIYNARPSHFSLSFILVFLLSAVVCPASVLSGKDSGQHQKEITETTTEEYDVLIVNGRIIDGTGNPWYYADIAIKDGKIAWIGRSDGVTASEIVDAGGLYISPGFIDVHSHAGGGLIRESLSHARPLLAQGVTTVIINQDGGGSVDIAGQRDRLTEHGLGVNVVQLVPHGTIRREVLGMENRAPGRDEMEEMKSLVEKGMADGAFGLSSGLFYTPGAWAETEEIIELAAVAGRFDGVYTSHIRDESDYSVGLIEAVEEVIEISREAGIPGVVTHIKALGTGVWGFSVPVINRIERAREEGVEVFADQYPYPASHTNLTSVLIPAWAREGGQGAMLERLDDPEKLEQVKEGMKANLERRGGAERLQIASYSADETLEGQRLNVIAESFGMSAIDTALELIKTQSPGVVSFNMLDDDVNRFMQQAWTMTSSDGGLTEPGDGVVHPRNYGSFSRKIGRYVREHEVVDLPFAIRSMTSLSATVFRLHDRGLIREGMAADIAIFDLEQIQDKATYQEPHQLSEGMVHLLVNGKFAIKNSEFIPDMHGRVLRLNE
jgi:N-acyl-D-amino-acid deacylase